MRYVPKRVRSVRLLLISTVVVFVVLGGTVAIAIAAYPQDSVTVYTGCLSTGGSGGIIGSVAVGSSPTKPCGSNQLLIHLSGGTITQVTAGTGLEGGGNNGYVGVDVKPGYRLPQTGCSSGQFVASDGVGGWSCKDQKTYSGSDFAVSNQSCGSAGQFVNGIDGSGNVQCANDQTYSNGDGLNLSGNTFSLKSGYQLPQGCSAGQVASSNGDGTWSCQSAASGLSTYTETSSTGIGDNSHGVVTADCNSGDIATGGGFYTDGNAGINYSQPDGSNGWTARATVPFDFGFGSGNLEVYVVCLH
jgi:hypothetical protein